MKHVGKMKNNGAKIAIVYRTLPDDPYSALVVGTGNLGDSYHDALINLIQDPSGQSAYELAEILAVRSFPDGSNILQWLHSRGQLKKVPTKDVLVTPTPQDSIPLDELNVIIAEQRGVSLEELSVTDGKRSDKVTSKVERPAQTNDVEPSTENMSAADLRSKADLLFKQAQQLRRKADELDPPKRKEKKVVTAETE